MTNKRKIMACYGNLTAKSTAKIVGVTVQAVYSVWYSKGLFAIDKNPQRKLKNQ